MMLRRLRMGSSRRASSVAAHARHLTRVLRQDDGGAAAELAVATPAVMVVLTLCLGALTAGVTQLALADAAADAARAIARGDDLVLAEGRVHEVDPAASLTVSEEELVCVDVRAPARLAGQEIGVTLSARACAMGEGR